MRVSQEKYEQVVAHVWDGSNESPRWVCLKRDDKGKPTAERLVDDNTDNTIAWYDLSGETPIYEISRIYASV